MPPAGIEPAITSLRQRGHRVQSTFHTGMERVKSNVKKKENNKHWFCALQQLRYCPYTQAENPAPLFNNRVKFEILVTVIVS